MTPESNPNNYNFPTREKDVSQEIRERHFGVLENRLKRHAFEYAGKKFEETKDFETYRTSATLIKATRIIFDDSIADIGKEERSYIGFISEFIDPVEKEDLQSYIAKELEES